MFATLVGGIYTVAGGRVEFSAGFGTGAHGFAMMVVWGGLAVLAIVSFFDDALSLAPLWRLLVQIGVAAAIVKAVADLGVWQTAFAVLLMVWMVNLYNFMDGMDGFAAGMAVVGFGALSVVAKLQGAEAPAEGCAIVAGAALGFLFINFPPARLFMGDLGSTLLGALAGLMLLVFHQEGILPVWLGILIFSPFVVDATVTLIRRVLRGERFWEAHRQHYYQRLVRRGWGHRKTVLAEYVLMALTASSAVIANGLPLRLQWAIIGVWVLIYAVLMYAIDRTEPKENEAAPV
ncbi:MraY family glycosyltransferase [Thiohalobacter sp.]|uniref:MraY family glycosyltransferase n=1 Tax=Thiohalobacter sp. TaxID=2025948 RepID=UPI002608DCB1|nr:glycosyltransferase family 4 protein [Thiohalobacter sp.]